MTDICLVAMPYCPAIWPSLGLGLLVSAGKQAGFKTKAVYANLWFLEQTGFDAYTLLFDFALPDTLLAEWTFSDSAFPGFKTDHKQYLSEAFEHDPNLRYYFRRFFGKDVDPEKKLFEIRSLAGKFIETAAQRILESRPRIVGCSSSFQQICPSAALLRKIKELDPSVITMLGGANCEGRMGLAAKKAFTWVDFVISGEADNVFPELCGQILGNGNKQAEYRRPIPPGVFYSGNIEPLQGKDQKNNDTRQRLFSNSVTDLESLPVPDYDDFFEEFRSSSINDKSPFISIEGGRGCWKGGKQPCTFCGLNGDRIRYRAKTSKRLFKELEELSRRYKTHNFWFTDNIFKTSYFSSFLPEIKRNGAPYKLFLEVSSKLDENQAKAMSEAGVFSIQPGIENLHDRILQLLNKGTTALDNITLLKFALENKLKTNWNYLYGIPGVPDSWYAETAAILPRLYHLPPPSLSILRFDRFSQYHRQPEKFGIELSPSGFYSHIYPLKEEEINDFAYFFEDDNHTRRRDRNKPGIKALYEGIRKWLKLFGYYNRLDTAPRLAITFEGRDKLVITDTRPCAESPQTELSGLEQAIHSILRYPRTLGHIKKHLSSEYNIKAGDDQIIQTLEFLDKQKIIINMNNRYLSLVVYETKCQMRSHFFLAKDFLLC